MINTCVQWCDGMSQNEKLENLVALLALIVITGDEKGHVKVSLCVCVYVNLKFKDP